MDTLDLKQLKKIADACRKAGIKTFKGYGYEFTLAEAPVKQQRKGKSTAKPSVEQPDNVPTDEPSKEDLMFWSVGGLPSQGEQ